MTGFQIINDVQRIAATEARSAEPAAPVRPDHVRALRGSTVLAIRLQLTVALRRIANRLEPAAPAATDPMLRARGQRC